MVMFIGGHADYDLESWQLRTQNLSLPTSQAFWKTRRPDEAADYRAAKRYVYGKKISQTLQSVE